MSNLIEFAKEQCKIFPEDSEMGKYLRKTLKMLQTKSCEDMISRRSLKHKMQECHDFFVDAYGGFSNLSQNDKSRVDEISNCIAMIVNEPPAKPSENIYEESKLVLEQIRNELLDLADADAYGDVQVAFSLGLFRAVEVIDKYEAEMKGEE